MQISKCHYLINYWDSYDPAFIHNQFFIGHSKTLTNGHLEKANAVRLSVNQGGKFFITILPLVTNVSKY